MKLLESNSAFEPVWVALSIQTVKCGNGELNNLWGKNRYGQSRPTTPPHQPTKRYFFY